MSYKRVGFGAVETMAADVHNARERLNGVLEQLAGDLAPITRDVSNWDAAAADAYRQHQQKWDEAARELNDVLNIIGTNVQTAHANYVQAETVNQGMWQG
jgi:6 kDa early secretory antigenic target